MIDPTKYLEDSGVLENLTEPEIKKFFSETVDKFKDHELDKNEISKVINELLYQHIYDQEIELKDSGLISAMELATELSEVEEDTQDYHSVMDPIEEYLSHHEIYP